ncbi:MAG: glycosyltransferase [Candidatus Eremiobacteraeota bacterium]|nr:glycosyltransferase [Candidatus Eremiobacteraeota bacterium]
MEQLRVGFFTECYRPIVNGIVASVDALAGGLRDRGHDVYLFTPNVPGYVEETGSETVRIPSLPLPATPYRLTLPLVSRRNLKGIIKQLSIIHAHSPFVTGWMGVGYARRFHIPLVYTYHTRLEQYAHYVPFDAATTRRAASTITRLYANAADAVIVPTDSMREHLLEVGVTARIDVVPSGIDVRLFGSGGRTDELRAHLGAAPTDRLAVFVSRLAREKNVELVLEALARVEDPRVKLVLVGDGPAREWLELQVQELGLSGRVTFTGELPRMALPNVYACADAFVFPSLTETQGLVLAEAMAAGCPIIAVDTPQARDVLGTCATFVQNDATHLALELGRMDLPAPEQREKARQGAERFGAGLQTERVLSIYADLLEREPALTH